MNDLEVHHALGRIEAKLDASLALGAQHAVRISKLERWQSRIAGYAAAVGGLGGAVIAYLWKGVPPT